MRLISKFAGLVHNVFCVFSLLTYALVFWPVSSHWLSGFIMMSLPVIVLIHILISVFGSLSGARKIALNSFVMVLISFPFWSRTFRLSGVDEESSESFSVMSYNIHKLGVGINVTGEKPLVSADGLAWLKERGVDLLCFQEVYHLTNSPTDLVAALSKVGYKHFALINHKINQKPQTEDSGIGIFSKHKLINLERRVFVGQNAMLKADVVLGKDTLTIINVHFQSMTLNLDALVRQREIDGVKSESQKTFSLLKEGFLKRNEQVEIVEDQIRKSVHPVIVCGDFNETPYGFTYGRISGMLANSFEKGGSGFGFTFRNLPYFIRIDNQFYDPDKIDLKRFVTVRDLVFSDHRPIIGDYVFRD